MAKTKLDVACFINATFSEQIDGKWKGASIDILRQIEREVNVEFNIIETPFKRLVSFIQNGRVDLSCPIFYLEEREAWGKYLKTVPAYEIPFYRTRSRNNRIIIDNA